MQLYGFLTGEDLQVFKLLIGVSGIGPKAGLNIFSCLSPDELAFCRAGRRCKNNFISSWNWKEDRGKADSGVER